jgi:hypothetical protein
MLHPENFVVVKFYVASHTIKAIASCMLANFKFCQQPLLYTFTINYCEQIVQKFYKWNVYVNKLAWYQVYFHFVKLIQESHKNKTVRVDLFSYFHCNCDTSVIICIYQVMDL